MKTITLLTLVASATMVKGAAQPPGPPSQPPPPTVIAPVPPVPANPAERYVYDQKPLPGRPLLVQPQQAQAVVDRFREAYPKLGRPRLLIYVNRELVDDRSGLKLSARTERTEATRSRLKSDLQPGTGKGAATNAVSLSAGGNLTIMGDVRSGGLDLGPGKAGGQSERVVAENTYRLRDRENPALADKQTVRDIERLFGRPLRTAGAALADQGVAAQLIADKPLANFTTRTEGESARKDRETLAKIADVVIEILISARNVTVPEVSGDRTYALPDIQATAIRLSDAKIMGQASASDLIGRDRQAYVAQNFGVHEIAEATALALMEDMLLGVK